MADGRFGKYGGRYVPDTLMAPLQELEIAFNEASVDKNFQKELDYYLRTFVGRPTPLTFAEKLSVKLNDAKVYLKREDLAHTGAHKINNTMGQILLARRMGKKRIVAETGAGQHGVATATVAALFGLKAVIYMGSVDMARQALNVYRMRLLGAEVVPVDYGLKTLKDATSEAMRDWVTNIRDTFYVLGSALGPHPYPTMVRDFQKVIGLEAREQILSREARLPDYLVACVGGGSNSIGLFHPFIKDSESKFIGVEAGGRGIKKGEHAARFAGGSLGVLHGTMTYLLQDEEGQTLDTHSISAGLDYPAVGPEHSFLKDQGRAQYGYATDKEALEGFHALARMEGIIPALESAHAIGYLLKNRNDFKPGDIIVVCLSGRGDKDIETVRRLDGEK